jgi:hypothetical protein
VPNPPRTMLEFNTPQNETAPTGNKQKLALELLKAMRGDVDPSQSALGPQYDIPQTVIEEDPHGGSFEAQVPKHGIVKQQPPQPWGPPQQRDQAIMLEELSRARESGRVQQVPSEPVRPKPPLEQVATPEGFRSYMATLPPDEAQSLMSYLKTAQDDQHARHILAQHLAGEI